MPEKTVSEGDSQGGGDLFSAAASPAVHVEDVERRFGAGRPAGSANKANRQILEMVQRIGGDPRLALARIMATPWAELARELSCKKLEAAQFWLSVVKELAPYVARKQPQDIALSGKVANFNIDMGSAGAHGRVVAGPAAIMALLDEVEQGERASGFDPHAGGQIEHKAREPESDDETTG